MEANIEVTRHELPLDRFYLTYRWIGNKSDPVFVSDMIEIDCVKLPWKLIRIGDYDYSRQGYWYVRKDAMFWFLEPIKIFIHKAWRWFGNRFVLTLEVWGIVKKGGLNNGYSRRN